MTSDAAPGYLSADDCRLADLIDLVSQKTDLADYPYAAAVEQNTLIYDGARLRKELSGPAGRLRVEGELARALLDGPGIVMLAGAFDDPWVIDRATRQFEAIIAAQRAAGGAAGDHFAAAGQNDRIWNALEKLALRPRYSRTTTPTTSSRPCAGPGWGPAIRSPRRSTWSTRAARRRACTGTTTWGSPPTPRPRGSRRTCTGSRPCSPCRARSRIPACRPRPARPCTCRTRISTCPATWPGGGRSSGAIGNVIAACAEGYAFPANLDLDQPIDGLAPLTQADILSRAVAEGWSRQQLKTELGAWSARRQTRRPS
jgi:hypothetical protein